MVETQKYSPVDFNEIKLEEDIVRKLHFQFLPAYALYFLEYKLANLSEDQIELFSGFKPPALSYFHNFKREELMRIGNHVE
jgi:hypothetical protein